MLLVAMELLIVLLVVFRMPVLVLLATVPLVAVVVLLVLKASLELLAAVVVGKMAADELDAGLEMVAVAQNLFVGYVSSTSMTIHQATHDELRDARSAASFPLL